MAVVGNMRIIPTQYRLYYVVHGHLNDTEPEGPKTWWKGSKVWGPRGGIQGRGVVGTNSESAFRRRADARGRFHTRSLPLRPFTHGASGAILHSCKSHHNFIIFHLCPASVWPVTRLIICVIVSIISITYICNGALYCLDPSQEQNISSPNYK